MWYCGYMFYKTAHILSVQFRRLVLSDSLRPHEPQHTRPPCPSPTPGVYPDSDPLNQWCHPTSHPLLSPAPPALNLSQHQGLFKWVSSLHQVAKILEFQLKHQSFWWTPELISFRMDWLISLQSKGLSRVFSNTTVQKHQFFSTQLSSQSNFHILTWKTIALTRRTFVGEVMSLLFSMLSRLVITFLPRSKRLLISWLQSPSAVIPLQPLFPLFPHHFPWSEGTGCHDLSFLNVEL